jgi:hypothetical protein
MTRYDASFLKVFPTPEKSPCQRETLIEIYRKGKIVEAFQAFKKLYLTLRSILGRTNRTWLFESWPLSSKHRLFQKAEHCGTPTHT